MQYPSDKGKQIVSTSLLPIALLPSGAGDSRAHWFLLEQDCSRCHGGQSQNEGNNKCICRKCTGILQASVLGFACTGNTGGFCQSPCGDRDVSSLQVSADCHCLPGSPLKFSICTLLKWTQSVGRATVSVAALWSALGFENFWCGICKMIT